jgi:rhodanese-related sulfurtransferase
VNPDELLARIEAGEWVVDLRNRTAFAAGHLAGTRGFELSGSFVTYLGWLYDWGEPLTLIAENTDQIAQARRELVRIGIDELAGAAVGDVDNLSAGTELRSYRVGSFAELAEAMDSEDLTILDVRQHKEYETSHISGALNIPLHELIGRMSDVPEGEVWVHCASGYRSSIAASLIDRPGRTSCLSTTSTRAPKSSRSPVDITAGGQVVWLSATVSAASSMRSPSATSESLTLHGGTAWIRLKFAKGSRPLALHAASVSPIAGLVPP